MKRFLLILTLITIGVTSSYAQNGGQSAENAFTKLEYISYNNGVTTFRVTNKQTVASTIELQSGSQHIFKAFTANTSDTMSLVGLSGTSVKIKVIPDNLGGAVELTLNISSLPVHFGVIKAKLITSKISKS